jgi:hypothetical protein
MARAIVILVRPVMFFIVMAAASLAYFASPSGRDTPFDPRCEGLDLTAGSAIATLVTRRDEVAERQLGDALFRLHRARRNCRLGWVDLARLDYESLREQRHDRTTASGSAFSSPSCAPSD